MLRTQLSYQDAEILNQGVVGVPIVVDGVKDRRIRNHSCGEKLLVRAVKAIRR